MKTITCDFYGIHGWDIGVMNLLIFDSRFPQNKNGNHAIHVKAVDFNQCSDGTVIVTVGRAEHCRSFLIKVRNPRRFRKAAK